MKYGNVYVSMCDDVGENESGIYCQVYSDEDMEDEIDSFCICPDHCDCNDDEAVENFIKWYLGIKEQLRRILL